MFIAYKYRIYPSQEQKTLIDKTIGCCRLVYNLLLAECKKQYEETGKSKVGNYKHLRDTVTGEDGSLFMKEVDSTALNYARLHLDIAYKNFFTSLKKGIKPSFPQFKSKHKSRLSYTSQSTSNNIRISNGVIRLPKLGEVKIIQHIVCGGKIKSATIEHTKSDRFFASVLFELPDVKIKQKNPNRKVLGIDMSYKNLAVLSDGTKVNYPHFYRKGEKRLCTIMRKFSRSIKGSHNHEKLRIKVARKYEQIANQRKDFLDKLSNEIAKKYNVIVLEDINMKSMASRGISKGTGKKKYRKRFGKTVNDLGFGMFRTMLEYKTAREGGLLVKADRMLPSSQLCSKCGYKNPLVKNLAIREWKCPECGKVHDRDINAAINLVNWYKNRDATARIKQGA